MTISECIKRGIRNLLGGCFFLIVLLAFLILIWEIGPIITFAGDCLSNILSSKIWLEYFQNISASENKMSIITSIIVWCAGAVVFYQLAALCIYSGRRSAMKDDRDKKVIDVLEKILKELENIRENQK